MKRTYWIITVFALLLLAYIALAWQGLIYLENQRLVDAENQLKISDYVAVSVAIAATLTGCIAAVFSYSSLRFAQKAEQGKLYLQLMDRYSSKEMADAMRLLGKFLRTNRDHLEQAFRDWKFKVDSGNDPEATEIENARHRLKYFYRHLMQLYQGKYVSRELVKRIMNTGGRHLFMKMVLEMEKYSNPLQFVKEFYPFEELYEELEKEQKLSSPGKDPIKKICLIPARYNAERYPGKLLKLLGTEKTGKKTVIRVTYERIVSHKLFDMVAVVTNSLEIKEEIEKHGGTVLYFEKEHNSGTDRIAEAVKNIDAGIIVNVQGDEPFVEKQPLEDLLKVINPDVNPKIVGSLMRKMDNPSQINSPDFVKVVCDKRDFALYFSRSVTPYVKNTEPEAEFFEHIGVYAFTKPALLEFAQLAPTNLEKIESVECLRFLENGIPLKMVKTDYHALEIDTEADLEEANRKIEAGEYSI